MLPELAGNEGKVELGIKANETEILNVLIEMISGWKVNQLIQ